MKVEPLKSVLGDITICARLLIQYTMEFEFHLDTMTDIMVAKPTYENGTHVDTYNNMLPTLLSTTLIRYTAAAPCNGWRN